MDNQLPRRPVATGYINWFQQGFRVSAGFYVLKMCKVEIERGLVKVSARFQLKMCKVKIERILVKVSARFQEGFSRVSAENVQS